MKNFSKVAITGILALFCTVPVFAQSTSYGGYGGYGSPSPAQSIMVDKLVSTTSVASNTDVNTVQFADNLSSTDHRFKPQDLLLFKIRVKNTSSTKLSGVVMEDLVPSGIEPQNGVAGYNSSTRIVSTTVGDLEANQEKDYVIPMQIVTNDKLPADLSVICLVNKAQAASGSIADEDSTQFCIEKQVLGATTISATPTPTPAPNVSIVPRTGPEYGFALFGLEAITLTAGVILRRKVS